MDSLSNNRHIDHPPPMPGYVSEDSEILSVDPQLYGEFAKQIQSRQLVDSFVIPVRDGRAWKVPAGHVCRFSVVDGPQVLDLNIWGANDPRERFWASRTRQIYGTHVTTGARLISSLPFLRPLATVIADTIDYGFDTDGAGCHDLLGTRCDPYVSELLSGVSYPYHCHSNLSRAAAQFGLTEFDVHDVINLFQVTGLMPQDHRYFMKKSPGRPGDYFELFAETDLIMAASTCPGGDLAVPIWGPGSDAEPNCNPIGIEVYKVAEDLLTDWSPSKPSSRPWVADEAPLDPKASHEPLTASVSLDKISR